VRDVKCAHCGAPKRLFPGEHGDEKPCGECGARRVRSSGITVRHGTYAGRWRYPAALRARIVADAIELGPTAAARKHGTNRSSVRLWRLRARNASADNAVGSPHTRKTPRWT